MVSDEPRQFRFRSSEKIDENGNPHGYAIKEYSNHDFIEGYWKHGVMHGWIHKFFYKEQRHEYGCFINGAKAKNVLKILDQSTLEYESAEDDFTGLAIKIFDRRCYIGMLENGQRSGYGFLRTSIQKVDDSVEELRGYFQDNCFMGDIYTADNEKLSVEYLINSSEPLRLNYKDGRYYIGGIRNGKLSGFGTIYSSEGEKIEQGYFQNGEYLGKLSFSTGELSDPDYIGKAKLSYKSGGFIAGDWRDGSFNGNVHEKTPEYEYSGHVTNGKWHDSNSRITFSDGTWYIGQTSNDKMHGEGTMYRSNDYYCKGFFKNSEINGEV